MASVTKRIGEIKQPKGGYIKPSAFKKFEIHDGIVLNENENIHSSIVGMTVDYLTRFIIGANLHDAFEVSLRGASIAELMGQENSLLTAEKLLRGIIGIDDASVVNACKLVTFDVWQRNPLAALMAKSYNDTNPDKATIQNIQTLVKRSNTFFEEYGYPIKDGFTFEPVKEDELAHNKMLKTGKGTYGGYTAIVSSGDGDFLTEDTMWDFKVTKSKLTNKHTLQLLMYWIMGQHSGQEIYKKINRLGIFNPRLNIVYLLDIKDISNDIINVVEKEVICYE